MLKEMLVGTGFDGVLLRLRTKAELLTQANKRSLSVGTVMNDHLSTFLVVRLCDTDKVFVDIGAHIGSIISEVKAHSSPSKIIAFEAIPDKAKKLSSKFKDVEVYECAVSDSTGLTRFFIDQKLSGYSSLNKMKNSRETTVEMNLVDNLVDRNDVDVIKIDIEGAELGALRGSVKLIERCKPVIMFESGPSEVLGYTKEAMWQFFESLGYQLFIPNRLPHSAKGLSLEAFIDSHQYPRRTTNYFAVHNSRIDEIKTKAMNILTMK